MSVPVASSYKASGLSGQERTVSSPYQMLSITDSKPWERLERDESLGHSNKGGGRVQKGNDLGTNGFLET